MPLRSLDDQSFDAFIGQPAVVAFVRRKEPESRAVLALLEALAPDHAPEVGFAMVDVLDCPGLAARFSSERLPAVLLFDDFRGCGHLSAPLDRDALVRLIETRLAR